MRRTIQLPERFMHGKITCSLIIAGLLLLSGCAGFTKYGKLTKRATKSYQKGSYDQAVRQVVNALRIKPDYDKAQKVLVNSFNPAVRNHEDQITHLAANKNLTSVDQIVAEYETLIKLQNMVRDLPPLSDKKTGQPITFELNNYSSQLATANENAAEAHFQEGHKFGQFGGRENCKAAAKQFKKASFYVSNYKEADSLYEKYKQAGLKHIAIIPFQNKSGRSRFGAIGEMVSDQITTNIMNDAGAMEFLQIVSRVELERVMAEQRLGLSGFIDDATAVELGKILGVHEILTGKITQIVADAPQTARKNIREQNEIVIRYEKYTDSKGKKKKRPVYGKVHASVKTFKLVAKAKISGSYKIIDIETAKLKKTDSFTSGSEFVYEWASFTGDKRALSGKSKALVARDPEVAPSAGERVNEAASKLALTLANTIKDYTR